MRTEFGAWRATYTHGRWVVLSGPTAMVIMQPAPSAATNLINRLWEKLIKAASITQIGAELTAAGLDSMPNLAAFFWDDDQLHCLLRGAIRVLEAESGEQLAAGSGAHTWYEISLTSKQVYVPLDDDDPRQMLQLPLVVGAVMASAVYLDAVDAPLKHQQVEPQVVSDEGVPQGLEEPNSADEDAPAGIGGFFGEIRTPGVKSLVAAPVTAAAVPLTAARAAMTDDEDHDVAHTGPDRATREEPDEDTDFPPAPAADAGPTASEAADGAGQGHEFVEPASLFQSDDDAPAVSAGSAQSAGQAATRAADDQVAEDHPGGSAPTEQMTPGGREPTDWQPAAGPVPGAVSDGEPPAQSAAEPSANGPGEQDTAAGSSIPGQPAPAVAEPSVGQPEPTQVLGNIPPYAPGQDPAQAAVFEVRLGQGAAGTTGPWGPQGFVTGLPERAADQAAPVPGDQPPAGGGPAMAAQPQPSAVPQASPAAPLPSPALQASPSAPVLPPPPAALGRPGAGTQPPAGFPGQPGFGAGPQPGFPQGQPGYGAGPQDQSPGFGQQGQPAQPGFGGQPGYGVGAPGQPGYATGPQAQPAAAASPASAPRPSTPTRRGDAATDHDGETVFTTGIALTHKPSGGRNTDSSLVLAATCPLGHANAPGSMSCRVCGASVDSHNPQLVNRPVLAVVATSAGERMPLNGPILIGRAPTNSGNDLNAELLRVPSPNHDISRTHVRVAPHEWVIKVSDLHSTNGTTLRPVDGPPVRLEPGQTMELAVGGSIDLGDGQLVTLHPAQ